MQLFRSNLTRLRGLITQKLPDENDIFGYSGVSKSVLLKALDSIYSMSQEIKDQDETRFEVISLKRAGSELNDNLREYFESDAGDQKKQKRFDNFLNNFSALVEKTRMTYFIVVNKGIRNEEELATIRQSIEELKPLSEEIKLQRETVASEIDKTKISVQEINASHANAVQWAQDLEKWQLTANKNFSDIEKTHDSIAGWDKEIQNSTVQFQTLSNQLSDLYGSAQQFKDKLNTYATEGEQQSEQLKKTTSDHNLLLDEIRLTLEDANKYGMGSSFKKRKDELGRPQIIWLITFVGTMVLMGIAVWQIVLPTVTVSEVYWPQVIVRLGLVSPLIWLGWMAAKQYGYTSRIREDYAFKSAAAMAYEGHKKAAREVNPELERVLIEFSVFNMAQNPLRIYERDDMDSSPFHELSKRLLDKLPSFKRATEPATLNRLTEIIKVGGNGEKEAALKEKNV